MLNLLLKFSFKQFQIIFHISCIYLLFNFMKIQLLFICLIIALNAAWIKEAEQTLENLFDMIPTHQRFKGNSSTNITNEEMRFINNAVNNAEKLFTANQLNEIAKSVSTTLTVVTDTPWSVFVYDRFTSDIGIAMDAYQNKTITLIQTGNYKLSYVIVQWSPSRCKKLDRTLAINDTTHKNYFGVATLPAEVQSIQDTASSSAIYAGEEVDLAAKYIRDKMSKIRLVTWNAVVSKPVSASGSYFCPYNQDWGMLIGFGDFQYNYIVFQPPN